jgi:hypothetical protein
MANILLESKGDDNILNDGMFHTHMVHERGIKNFHIRLL